MGEIYEFIKVDHPENWFLCIDTTEVGEGWMG